MPRKGGNKGSLPKGVKGKIPDRGMGQKGARGKVPDRGLPKKAPRRTQGR